MKTVSKNSKTDASQLFSNPMFIVANASQDKLQVARSIALKSVEAVNW